ncbi:hypothetical protein, partial [Paenibacillus gorillae]|uniref:hypothetical protein n=1 Tax=Paenibacillus gorillae TaxID=1243662 RepID=UPI001EE20539
KVHFKSLNIAISTGFRPIKLHFCILTRFFAEKPANKLHFYILMPYPIVSGVRRVIRFGGLAVWRFGGLAVWRFGGLAVWRFGGLAVWRPL